MRMRVVGLRAIFTGFAAILIIASAALPARADSSVEVASVYPNKQINNMI